MNSYQKITALGLAAALAVVATWEGVKTKAYRDVVNIPTICYGYTHGVKMGDTKTPKECEDLLVSEVLTVYNQVRKCINVRLTEGQRAAVVSLAYNVGSSAVCKSTFVKKLNAKDPTACDELHRWVFAGGREVQGLVNRRKAEWKVCTQ